MEEKTIVITEKAENQILGQEGVFGWQMKEKKNAGRFLFFKYCQYTLFRDRKEENITQAHIDVENRWNNEFSVWNKFILNRFKTYILAEIATWVMILVGFILTETGAANMDIYSTSVPVSCIAGLILLWLGVVVSILLFVMITKNATKRLKMMDTISRDMRQVNAVRSTKSEF